MLPYKTRKRLSYLVLVVGLPLYETMSLLDGLGFHVCANWADNGTPG